MLKECYLRAACGLFLVLAAHSGAALAAPQGASKPLHALFDKSWLEISERFPEWATSRGDYRYNDRLTDPSLQADVKYFARTRAYMAKVERISAQSLSPQDRISRSMFISGAQDRLALEPYEGYRLLSIAALGGLQSNFAELLQVVPLETTVQAEQLLTRMAAYPKHMDQQIVRLQRAEQLGWVSPKASIERALDQIDKQLPQDLENGPFYAPFKRLNKDIPEAQRQRLVAAGREAVLRDVIPSMQKLRAFLVADYLPKAPTDGAMLRYPDGTKLYEQLVRQQTTTNLTAAEVHAIGLREMARIRGEMEAIQKQVKFEGDFAAFIHYLNTDPKFFYKSPEEFLAGYRDITKRFDAELPRFFAVLPRAPYGVRAMPAYMNPDSAEYYKPPTKDASRPGYFYANALGFKKRPTWGMASLAAHEAVPGHHLQNARALELGELPEFRRNAWYIAFGEGWALYAETLGNDMGMYDDPYSKFGHLQWQALRAARLVVDTGIHHMGWSRQQAVDYMIERTGIEPGFVSSEVDRYTSWPGQALGYMIGQLKIIELRDRAKAKLGMKFDVRRFHNAVIDNGTVPLNVLEQLIDEWIAKEARKT